MRVSQPCCPCTPQVSLTCGLSPVSMDPYGLRGLYDRRLDVDYGWVQIDGWMVVALRGDVLTNLVSSSPASLLHPDPLSQLPPRTSRHNKIEERESPVLQYLFRGHCHSCPPEHPGTTRFWARRWCV